MIFTFSSSRLFADSPKGGSSHEQLACELDELAGTSCTACSVADSTSGRLFGSFVSRRRHFTQSRFSLVILKSWTLVTKSLDAFLKPFFILDLRTLNGSKHDGWFAVRSDILPSTPRQKHWHFRLLCTPGPRHDWWTETPLTCSIASVSDPLVCLPLCSSRSCVFPSPVLGHVSPLQAKPSVSNCRYTKAASDGTAGSPAAIARIGTTWVHSNARSPESWRSTIIFFDWGDSQNCSGFLKVKNSENFEGFFVSQNFEFFKFISKIFSGFAKFVFLLPKCSLI